MRFGYGLLCFAGLFAVSIPAYALAPGECGTPEAITKKLKAEDQHSFATAENVERENNLNTLYGMIFTVSTDKSVGYILESDRPTGEKANKICVHERMADLRIFDANKPGVPKEVLLKATDEDAHRRCDQLIKTGKVRRGTCGSLNNALQVGDQRKERVMFHGFNVVKQKDGTYVKDGTLTTVTGTMPRLINDDITSPMKPLVGGIYNTALPEGATMAFVILVYAEYTPYGEALLSK